MLTLNILAGYVQINTAPLLARLNQSFLGPGARLSKDPVTTGSDNLPGQLTGNFTGTGIAFLEAPVNFPDTYRVR